MLAVGNLIPTALSHYSELNIGDFYMPDIQSRARAYVLIWKIKKVTKAIKKLTNKLKRYQKRLQKYEAK